MQVGKFKIKCSGFFCKYKYLIKNLVVGLFLLSLLFFLIFVKSWLKDSDKRNNYYILYGTFSDISGVDKDTKIYMSGIEVGFVKKIFLKDDYSVVIRFFVDKKYKIPTDSSISVFTNGLLGQKYLEIQAGFMDEYLLNGEEFDYTQGSVDVEGLIVRAVNSFVKEDDEN